MRRRHLPPAVAVALGLATTVGAGGVAVAQLSSSGAADPLQRPNAVITAIEADQAAVFAVLRGEKGLAAQLTDRAADLIARGLGPDVGASAALARRAGTAPGGTEVYVVPAHGWVCLVTGDGSGSCNRTAEVIDGYGLWLQRQGSDVAIAGLVPDGVSTVEVRGGAGDPPTTVSVSANAWSAKVSFEPQSVRWTGPDATVHDVPVSVPPDAPTATP